MGWKKAYDSCEANVCCSEQKCARDDMLAYVHRGKETEAHRHRVNVLSVCLVVFKRVTPKMVGAYIKNQREETGIGAEL